jgi:peptidoglycan/LPS O-acetylase OafA/YrhL
MTSGNMDVGPEPAPPPRRRRLTLAQAYARGVDNFLLLRFLAAVAVIFGHSYGISGIPGAADFIARARWGNGMYTGSLAVDVFFVVSGFLVTGSYLHRANLEVFIKSRALRILPAYAACVVLSAFVLGAIYTELPLSDYLTQAATRDYVTTNLQFGTELIWTLPGVFAHNPFPDVVNGSLWTLTAEVRMYLWVAILGLVGVLQKRWLANAAFAVLMLAGMLSNDPLPLVPIHEFDRLAAFFLAGAFCYVNRDWIPLSDWLLLALVVLAMALHHSHLFPWALAGVVAYGALWFAYRPNLRFFNRFGDYSYGLYLWGFPIEQAVAHWFGAPTRPVLLFVACLPLTLLCAMASWHFLEKPALRLKAQT